MSALRVFGSLLTQLSGISSSSTKFEVLNQSLHGPNSEEFRKLFWFSLNPYVKFFVKKIPDAVVSGNKYGYEDVINVLESLSSREVSGREAVETVSRIRGGLDFVEVDAFDRILTKKLRCGVSLTSVNKSVKGLIPTFDVQLAHSDQPDPYKEVRYPTQAEIKWDGYRTTAIKEDGCVILLSREGNIFDNFEEINRILEDYMPDNTVFDGEVMHAKGVTKEYHNEFKKRAQANCGKNTDIPIVYRVYDAVPLAQWNNKTSIMPQSDRTALVDSMIFSNFPQGQDLVVPGEYRVCNNAEELMQYYSEKTGLGHEGLILKEMNAPYAWKRGKNWRKLKPKFDAELTVVGVTMGEEGGKRGGTIGAILCEGIVNWNNQTHHVQSELGTGMKDSDLKELMERHVKGDLIGAIVELEFQAVTYSKNKEHPALSFASFSRVRAWACESKS